jgi:hypothetical protein
MKTLPIIYADSSKKDRLNAILRASLLRERTKTNRVILIDPPKEEPNLSELIAGKQDIDFSEKIKKISKEIFGK